MLSGLCTHLTCAVQPLPGLLHCPCHGSQFTLEGAVTHGPAIDPLRVFADEDFTVQGTTLTVNINAAC